MGTQKDRDETAKHNQVQAKKDTIQILNNNVEAWLNGTVKIPDTPSNPKRPDTYSVRARYIQCLLAPNYTVFSNTASQKQYIADHCKEDSSHYVVSLESPHNAIHLAVGGFYQEGEYNANPIFGANGDMGDNETAGFDPIFFFHHCYIDYIFSLWQRLHKRTKRGDLTIKKGYKGTFLAEKKGQQDFPPGTPLDMSTPLVPFKKPGTEDYYTSDDATDLNELGIAYGTGFLHSLIPKGVELASSKKSPFDIIDPQLSDKTILAGSDPNGGNLFPSIKRVPNINRANYEGSFVIRLFATAHDGKEYEVGREPVLSRGNLKGCRNCQSHLKEESYFPLDARTLEILEGPGSATGQKAEIKWQVKIQTRDRLLEPPGSNEESNSGEFEWPVVDDL